VQNENCKTYHYIIFSSPLLYRPNSWLAAPPPLQYSLALSDKAHRAERLLGSWQPFLPPRSLPTSYITLRPITLFAAALGSLPAYISPPLEHFLSHKTPQHTVTFCPAMSDIFLVIFCAKPRTALPPPVSLLRHIRMMMHTENWWHIWQQETKMVGGWGIFYHTSPHEWIWSRSCTFAVKSRRLTT